MKIPKVIIYTGISLEENPGPGAWVALLTCEGKEKEIGGGEIETTNMRLHLLSAVEGLLALNRTCKVTIMSRSEYVMGSILKNWKARRNSDVIARLLDCKFNHDIKVRPPSTAAEETTIAECNKRARTINESQ